MQHFQNYLPFTDEEMAMISERAARRKVKRGALILQEGFTCKHYTFVVGITPEFLSKVRRRLAGG